MTGLPEFNFPAFFEAEEKLRQRGYLVVNPAGLEETSPRSWTPEEQWRWNMRRDIPALLTCDEIALLPGWQTSRGARLELHIGTQMGMPTWDYRDGNLHEAGSVPPLDAYGNLVTPI